MTADASNAVEFEGPLGQDQYGVEAETRPSGNRFDEDVRRFACDRCRSQKLRCERNRLSLHTPLKSTPCRRCIKTRVRCITSTQARIGRSLDETGARTQRRQTAKQNRAPTFDVQLGEYAGGSDDDGAVEGADREAGMHGSLDQQPCADSTIVNPIEGVIQSPAKIAGTGAAKFGPPKAQSLDGNPRSVVDLSILHEPQPAALYPKSMSPNKGKPMVAQNRVQVSPQQIQYTFDDFPSHLASPGGNAQFFEDTNSIVEHNFDGSEGVNWSDTSLMGTTNTVSLDQENDFASATLESHQDVSQYVRNGDGSVPLNNNGRPVASVDAFKPIGGTDFVNQSSTFQREHYHIELTGKLTQLTSTLLNELDLDQDDSLLTAQRADKPENQISPMSKLLWSVERFLGILADISVEKNMRCPSITDPFDSVLNALGVDDHDFERRAQPTNKNRSASSAPQLPSCGLPGLTTMMAIFATYSCVLQAYERVFDKIHRSLIRTGRSDPMSLSLLPMFQLDSVKFATQNSLQVHIAMEVSLQMLNQIENRLACIVSAYGSNCEETKACLLALLQSLTYNEGGDSMSASAMIRDTINGVRKLFIA